METSTTPQHLQLGTWGEEQAVKYLQRKGYTILERDWHSGHRDIDIIAWDGTNMVFVEVKARRNKMFMEPEEAVNYQKLTNLRRAINHYVKYKNIRTPWRFDVITVVGTPKCANAEIQHLEDFQLI